MSLGTKSQLKLILFLNTVSFKLIYILIKHNKQKLLMYMYVCKWTKKTRIQNVWLDCFPKPIINL